MNDIVLELKNVTKRFGSVTALKEVTFNVRRGQVFGYLGPKGAGKTTTVRIITGLLKPDEGTVQLFGENPYIDGLKSIGARKKIGVMLEKPGYFPHLSVYRNLLYYGRMYGLENLHERITYLLKRFGLWEWRNIQVNALSEEMRRKLAIARVLLHDPELLIFDEPTSGLDSSAQLEIRRLLRKIARMGKTMFFSSHNLNEVMKMCSHLAIIHKGKIVACDELRKLRNRYMRPIIYIKFNSKVMENQKYMQVICNEIEELNFVRGCRIRNGTLQVELKDFRFSPKLNEFLIRRGLLILEFRERICSLEDFYNLLVKKSD